MRIQVKKSIYHIDTHHTSTDTKTQTKTNNHPPGVGLNTFESGLEVKSKDSKESK